MESFLRQIDMSNLKSMIENDSDYGDEDEIAVCHDRNSPQLSQSVKSP